MYLEIAVEWTMLYEVQGREAMRIKDGPLTAGNHNLIIKTYSSHHLDLLLVYVNNIL